MRSANGQAQWRRRRIVLRAPSAGRRSPGSARFRRRPAGAAAHCHRPAAASRSPRRSSRRARPVPSPTARPCRWLRSGAVAKAARRHAARRAHRHDRAALSPRSVCPATTARRASAAAGTIHRCHRRRTALRPGPHPASRQQASGIECRVTSRAIRQWLYWRALATPQARIAQQGVDAHGSIDIADGGKQGAHAQALRTRPQYRPSIAKSASGATTIGA